MPRVLGLDFGTKRIGAALSDPRGLIASPLEVYERHSLKRDEQHYRELVANEAVERIVVGLPLHTRGTEGDLAKLCRNFGAWIGEVTGRLVVFQDERYTSREAEETMRSAGLKSRDRKARRDMLAAQILLQAYLDAGCPLIEAVASPLEDPVLETRDS